MPKCIFLDVDGTLTNYDNQIPLSAIQAIQTARQNGHKVFTVTGRSKAEMYDEILAIGFDGYIGGNGSYIELGQDVLYEKCLSAVDSRAIRQWLDQRGLEYYIESNHGLYASPGFEKRGQSTMMAYAAYKGQDGADQMTVRRAFPEMIFDGDLERNDLNKVSFILESYQDYLDAKAAFPHLKVGTWGGQGEKALFGDIGVANIDKGQAVAFLLAYLGCSRQDSLAFGDAKIDIPMLDYCQVGVAMGSGGQEIKAMADYVTDGVDQDGLYHAFKHFDLI
ncbi:Cof-type HAD-IIB family hydrolase [Vaginisenegalia massiliensis]|uniref:Cof-type HAD-IIB family hydrolase n=1 Tax=Vaginisenegalia massiliensis TaxID=2058294 RepID=UPI000F5290F5|nr:Cof-type HAD-IIB family hydrolase [Vaginisenegalia massiliensis]